MGKKKSSQPDANGAATTSAPLPISEQTNPPRIKNEKDTKQDPPPASSASLTITRNKHTRFISAFHGPWLQLPHEILETLAHSNFLSPRPRQTEPSVLYDLIKIRKLVDEASDLAVRAQNGTASSALGADNGLPGGALGISYRGVGGNAKLSPERKYRMRELAVHKLSQAYRLDEIAASVATMQGASALDHIGSFVLQRNPNNMDAKYVHFFHEKIPSRMMSESTPLTTLNEIISAHPGHAAPYRTRALTRIFKEDHLGAAQDLTDGLTFARMDAAKHKSGRNQLVTMKTAREDAEKRKVWSRDWMDQNRVLEEDQPKGIEMQLLFQRGNQYLTLACQHIRPAMDSLRNARQKFSLQTNPSSTSRESSPTPLEATPEYKDFVQTRETIRKYAKRALRDYTTFFSKLDYAHAPRHAANEDIFGREPIVDELEEFDPPSARRIRESNTTSSDLVCCNHHNHTHRNHRHDSSPPPPLSIHEMSTLLSTSPPSGLPSFPVSAQTEDYEDETLTYHPLLPETLHSFLLTHCLLQTDATTLLRHAYNVARLVRLADGYPFFLAARSPARADWCEILRKTKNFVSMQYTWEQLCKMPPPPSSADNGEMPATKEVLPDASAKDKKVVNGISTSTVKEQQQVAERPHTNGAHPTSSISCSQLVKHERHESADQKRDRIHKEAVIDALGDERVTDDVTFQRAVHAREKRAWRDTIEELKGPDGRSVNGIKELEDVSLDTGRSTSNSAVEARQSASPASPATERGEPDANGSAAAVLANGDIADNASTFGSAEPENNGHASPALPSNVQPRELSPPNNSSKPAHTTEDLQAKTEHISHLDRDTDPSTHQANGTTPSRNTTETTYNNKSTSTTKSTPDPASKTKTPSSEGNANGKHPDTSTHSPHSHDKTKPIAKDEEYLIGTERAESIARWVLEAPVSVDLSVLGLPVRRKKGVARRKKVRAAQGGQRRGEGDGGEDDKAERIEGAMEERVEEEEEVDE